LFHLLDRGAQRNHLTLIHLVILNLMQNVECHANDVVGGGVTAASHSFFN